MLFLKWFIIVGIVYILKSLITFASCVSLDCSRVLSRSPNQKLLKIIQIYSCFSRDINEDQAYNYSNTSLNIFSFLPYTMSFRVSHKLSIFTLLQSSPTHLSRQKLLWPPSLGCVCSACNSTDCNLPGSSVHGIFLVPLHISSPKETEVKTSVLDHQLQDSRKWLEDIGAFYFCFSVILYRIECSEKCGCFHSLAGFLEKASWRVLQE